MAVGTTSAPVCYTVKQIDFFFRKVPIIMQNENGPCPLLALANVLLLRNQVHLPLNTPEIAQDRLISLVAGYLLDSNNEERLAKVDASEEYRANIQQNIADAIALLPKLATGVDVNVRFNHIRAFEFTHDVAIFDLLDIRLVHGWLIDPQDVATCEAIDGQSYNEVVATLVSTLGDETPTHLRTSHSQAASFTSARSSTLQPAQVPAKMPIAIPSPQATSSSPATDAGTATKPPLVTKGQPDSSVSADKLEGGMAGLSLNPEESAELQQALALSLDSSDAQGVSKEEQAASSLFADTASSSVYNQPLTSAAASSTSAAAGVSHTFEQPSSSTAGMPASSLGAASLQYVAPTTDAQVAYDDLALKKGKMKAFVDVDPDEYYAEQASSSYLDHDQAGPSSYQLDPTRSGPSCAVIPAALPLEPSCQVAEATTPEPSLPAPPRTLPSAVAEVTRFEQSEQRARELQRANVIQGFLEATSSQLTHHGLLSLQQDLRSNELAVLFRNNHFNTIFYLNGSIYILVTDQGYLFEKNVVWEKLCDVNGNTEFVKGDFESYSGSPAKVDVSAAADLAQAAFSSVVPPRHAVAEPAAADPDADFALALKLQDQENERNQQFLQQQHHQQQQQQQQQRAQGAASAPQQGEVEKRQKHKFSRKLHEGASGGSGGKNKEEKCCIM